MNKIKRNKKKLVKRIRQIPTLPIISQKIMTIVGNENASFEELARVIEKDQALAIKILKVANSAFYGFLSSISSLEHALVILGINEVKSIVLGFSVQNFFSHSESDAFDRTRFWKHAIICSQVAKLLGRHYNIRDDDSLFLTGLIHDMGKVVLDEYFHEEFLQIIEHLCSNNSTFSEAEREILGTTHYQIAATLLKQWDFPDKVIMQVLYHHAPWYDENYGTNSIIIYLANILTKLSGYSCHTDEKQIDPHAFANSSEIDFIIKSGFDLDYETIKNLTSHIRESISVEGDNIMRLFE
ncbi:MAG: HDOD domain-containing protein [Deltaproteobacteria bacterium]|nr:HDOD domain-containing protein [Deltaproteobacteria bacterium]MBW1795402.1 HDOD domain-containing protein [Deltaproteobacteria bacterium]MBW2330776.1 HDOD domain-containing protein [Deltaproteobacteria bacterium]